MAFKIKFNIKDYRDILPTIPTDYSEVLNVDKEVEDQVWQKLPFPMVITRDFILQEAKRIKQGVWILIKGQPLWIPGNYYFFLQYWNAAGKPPKFRLKRLKAVYHKIRVRNNPRFIGTYVMKNRKDGETLFSMCDGMWEVLIEEQKHGTIASQSKTRDTVIGSCWKSLISGWNGLPLFFKDAFCSDFTSGNNIAEQLKFQRPANPADPNDLGKNVNMVYGPCVYNAFDAYADIIRLILDEVAKWVECSFYDAFTNYKKIIMPGGERRGLFDVFTSPADTNGRHNDEAYQLWGLSDGDKINEETGSTHSRLLRYYSNPLDGIEGFYDKYGDADPQEILEHIMRERKATPKDKLMGEIRGYPLPIIGTDIPNEQELFGAVDESNIWINVQGLKKRKLEIAAVKPTLCVYGNLIWPQNIQDSGIPEFIQADRTNFDEYDARFCLTDTQSAKIELADIHEPPSYIEECLGVDPFNLRYKTKNQVTGSLGAGISWKFRDILQTGKVDYPTLTYLSRPQHGETFYEDMIKAAIYRRAKVQYENSNDKMENYFEDRKFSDWLIDSIDAKPIEVNGEFKIRKGDAPSGKGATAFMNEGIGLINSHTNLPLTPNHPYLLDWFNFEEVIDDILAFNKENTQQNHFTMALIQALLGKTKLMFQKRRKRDGKNNGMIGHLMT
jgi:hypothetical protein